MTSDYDPLDFLSVRQEDAVVVAHSHEERQRSEISARCVSVNILGQAVLRRPAAGRRGRSSATVISRRQWPFVRHPSLRRLY